MIQLEGPEQGLSVGLTRPPARQREPTTENATMQTYAVTLGDPEVLGFNFVVNLAARTHAQARFAARAVTRAARLDDLPAHAIRERSVLHPEPTFTGEEIAR